MNRLAADIARRGWAAWNVEYRRTGHFGGGGGWPATLLDAAAALDHVEALSEVDSSRVVVCGHSAGAPLAWWAAGPRSLPPEVRDAAPTASRARVGVRGAVSLSGVLDLVGGAHLGLGNGAIVSLLGSTPDKAPDRYAAASPLALLPLGFEQVVIYGDDDSVVPPELAERYAKAAAATSDPVASHLVPGAGHLSMIDSKGLAWRVAVAHLERLLA